MKTINTGIIGLDEMLNGGIPENTITSLIGPAGSGKTIISLQSLYANLEQGRKCIYISAAHTKEELVLNAQNYGWDLTPYLKNKNLNIKKFDPVTLKFRASESILTSGYLEELPEFLYTFKADIIILDSITEFLMLCKNDIERRSRLLNLFEIIKANNSTALITVETDVNSSNSIFGICEYIADGIITLKRVQSEDMAELTHIIQINKMRWIKHSREIRQYEITDSGIEVFNKYQVMIGVGRNGGVYA